MDLKEIGINTRNWVDMAQNRDYWRALVNAVLNLRVPQTVEIAIIVIFLYNTKKYHVLHRWEDFS